MNVRWVAVLTGFIVDFVLSQLLLLLSPADFVFAIDLSRGDHLSMLALLVLSTGVGGYVAGRMAGVRRALHGLLVAAVGVLFGQLGGSALPQEFVLASVVAAAVGALGGALSRFPATEPPVPPTRPGPPR